MATAVDLITMVLVLGMTYALTSEGLWGAALMFFNTLFAALIAFNFYEPVAVLIVDNVSVELIQNFADVESLMTLFLVSLTLLRLTTDTLGPSMVRFPAALYHPGRILFGGLASVLMAGFVILAFETAPVQQKILGFFDWKYEPIYKRRFDRDFLAFFQYSSGHTFARNGAGGRDAMGEFPQKPMLFDPKAEWLLNHQIHRPYNPELPFEEEGGGAGTGAAATPGAAAPGGPGAPPAGGPGGPGPR